MLVMQELSGTAWSAISTSGQSGTLYVPKVSGSEGKNAVVVTHGTTAPSASTTNCIMVPGMDRPSEALLLTADGASDIYYLRCSGGSAICYTDMA